ncbi:thiamine pyrophosphate-binding protein [Candidatus Poriferisodalis sp.]|uniref:thiamine pyrophosphate-binding protein n=1 Tax=Candidatus Poriferisodalis sp. TaxID=3101277 RepID=UPI003B024A4C
MTTNGPSDPDRNGGDLLVKVLSALGTDAAFGVVSVHNLPLVDALAHRLRWVPTRSEAAAVNAADGYARVRRTPGCAVTSTGTGAANAAGALVEALTASSPILHVTSQIPSEYLGQGRGVIHETRDQLELLTSCSVWATTVGTDPATDFADAAWRLVQHPRGPVSLEWPIDLQYAATRPFDAALLRDASATPGTGPALSPEATGRASEPVGAAVGVVTGTRLTTLDVPEPNSASLARAAELIAAAQRPLVWAGGGAIGAGRQVDDLLRSTGAGLFTSNAGRGVVPESDARVIGNFAASPGGAGLLSQADLLISVGTHFRSNETRSYRLGLPPRHIQIDVDPAAVGRVYPAEVGIVGDAAAVLDALVDQLSERHNEQHSRRHGKQRGGSASGGDPDWSEAIAAARQQCRAQLRRDIGPYAAICDIMSSVLGERAPRVRDITIPNSSWGNRLLPVTDPTTNIVPRGGGIGQAVGMAIGAAVARPVEPTMVMLGDGGIAPQLGELATIAQEQLPVTLVVFDDGGYGVLRNTQDRHVGRRSGVDLMAPDFASTAAAFDLGYCDVSTPDEFAAAFEAATASGNPQMIRVDCDKLGPMPAPFVPPVDVPSGVR